MREFLGLRAKCYAFRTEGGAGDKKLKGINKAVVKKRIAFDDYSTCLSERKRFQHTMHRIGSRAHELFTYQQTKTSLNPYDDKRYLLADGITSLAYGHHRIPAAASEE